MKKFLGRQNYVVGLKVTMEKLEFVRADNPKEARNRAVEIVKNGKDYSVLKVKVTKVVGEHE